MIEIDKNIIIETEHLGSNNAIVCTRDGVVHDRRATPPVGCHQVAPGR